MPLVDDGGSEGGDGDNPTTYQAQLWSGASVFCIPLVGPGLTDERTRFGFWISCADFNLGKFPL